MAFDKNDPQALQLQLIRLASFNDFDGARVATDLEKHRSLWVGAMMTRPNDLIMLRDLPTHWNVDTLFLVAAKGKAAALEKLARTWKPDERSWIGGRRACQLLGSYRPEFTKSERVILQLWWD